MPHYMMFLAMSWRLFLCIWR